MNGQTAPWYILSVEPSLTLKRMNERMRVEVELEGLKGARFQIVKRSELQFGFGSLNAGKYYDLYLDALNDELSSQMDSD